MTRRERDLLIFICEYMEKFGKSPTYREMSDGLHLKSRGNTHRLMRRLEKLGYLKVEPKAFRGVALIEAKDAALWA